MEEISRGDNSLDKLAEEGIWSSTDMAWAKPQYTRPQVNAAARALTSENISVTDLDEAYAIVNNWRAIHSFPLNTLQNGLRRKAKRVDPHSLIAQRIKRLSSITLKLVPCQFSDLINVPSRCILPVWQEQHNS